jgi:hypothetical protein
MTAINARITRKNLPEATLAIFYHRDNSAFWLRGVQNPPDLRGSGEAFNRVRNTNENCAFRMQSLWYYRKNMDWILAKLELIASVAQDQRTWNLYTQQGKFFDQDPPTWQDLSRAEEILIKRRDWRARKRLLAYTSRRLRQERV